MNLLSIKRGIKLGLDNFKRNTFLTIATILVAGIIIFIFNIIILTNFTNSAFFKDVNERITLTVFLKQDADFYQTEQIKNRIQEIQSIESVNFISKEKALQDISISYPDEADFLELYNIDNPFPNTLEIKAKSPEDYPKIITQLKSDEFSSVLEIPEDSEKNVLASVSQNLSKVSSFTKKILLWLILIFAAGGLLIFINALRLTIFSRKNEIYVMRLVGAKYSFIRLPFLIEGIFYSLLAVIFSIALVITLLMTLPDSNLSFYLSNINFTRLFIVEIIFSILIGGISSLFTTNKYIKCKLSEY